MNADAARALDAAGITLRHYQPGNHRAPCPRCNRGPRDDALGVTVETDGSWVAHCFRCDWTAAWQPNVVGIPTSCRRADLGEISPRSTGGIPSVGLHLEGVGIPTPKPQRSLDMYVWNRCLPITPSCPVGIYLAGRGCALPEPHAVRWRAGDRDGYPEMVALITAAVTALPVSLHFTSIANDGSGKAPIERPRRYLFGHQKKGGVVRLTEDAEVTHGLCIGEGIETVLTAARAIGPCWACLDAGNVAAFPVLPGIEALTVLVDHDEAGERAAAAVRERWEAAGREVTCIKSAVPGEDFNDLARGAA